MKIILKTCIAFLLFCNFANSKIIKKLSLEEKNYQFSSFVFNQIGKQNFQEIGWLMAYHDYCWHLNDEEDGKYLVVGDVIALLTWNGFKAFNTGYGIMNKSPKKYHGHFSFRYGSIDCTGGYEISKKGIEVVNSKLNYILIQIFNIINDNDSKDEILSHLIVNLENAAYQARSNKKYSFYIEWFKNFSASGFEEIPFERKYQFKNKSGQSKGKTY
jgi:hypothetical protein